ncbi:MAG: MBL fold metallo-hydrolase [Candidatus Sericytochromatia bacterium]|nr:MBL fold metallo-hydrolase [Candidatus Sericytochromatia bacterium]
MRKALTLFFAALTLNACAALERPDLNNYREYFYAPAAAEAEQPAGVKVTYLGTSTLLLDDGSTRILIDGFFTRPGNLWQLAFGQVHSDKAFIRDALARLNVDRIDAIPVYHSHHDHAMDSAEIARLTGAQVLGSESTAWIMRGAGLPEQQYTVVSKGQPYAFGDFRITMIEGQHTELPGLIVSTGMMGDIDQPLTQPASIFDYREGETYTIIIEHPQGTSMLHSGALKPGSLKGRQIDTVFLCTPGIPKMSLAEREQYYQEVIAETGASKIIPVHWDDFTLPLNQPLVPLPRFAEDLDAAMQFLIQKQKAHPEVQLEFIPAWEAVPLF